MGTSCCAARDGKTEKKKKDEEILAEEFIPKVEKYEYPEYKETKLQYTLSYKEIDL